MNQILLTALKLHQTQSCFRRDSSELHSCIHGLVSDLRADFTRLGLDIQAPGDCLSGALRQAPIRSQPAEAGQEGI